MSRVVFPECFAQAVEHPLELSRIFVFGKTTLGRRPANKAWLRPAGPRIPAASNPIHNVQHRNPDIGTISGHARCATPLAPLVGSLVPRFHFRVYRLQNAGPGIEVHGYKTPNSCIHILLVNNFYPCSAARVAVWLWSRVLPMSKRFLILATIAMLAIAGAAGVYLAVLYHPSEPPTAPLVLDLDGDGIEINIYAHAYFDMDSDGYAEDSSWISSDDGLLVLDEDGDSAIDNVREILGTGGDFEIVDLHRALAAGQLTTGFNMLRQWDENGDR
jgi:hypothetical protein